MSYTEMVKTLTVRLPAAIANDIAAESRERGISKSDVVRERLTRRPSRQKDNALEGIADLVGAVDALPADLSARRKHYLRATGYGLKRPR